MGLIYFLKANFQAMGNDRLAKKTLLYGVLFTLAVIAILPFLPEKFPSFPFTVAYIIIARQVAEKYQMTKQAIVDSSHYDFQSNGRVFGMGLLCLLGSAVVIMAPLMLLSYLGIWSP